VILHFDKVNLGLSDFPLRLDLSLEGNIVAVFGPSGAGKTSLLDLVAGLRKDASGRITLDGTVLQDNHQSLFTPPRLRHIGYVSQSESLFPHLSVRGNVTYGLRSGAERTGSQMDSIIETLEIGNLLDRGVQNLSGGEKQRVAMARALVAGPRLLLLDEPLSGLDSALKEKVLGYLRAIRDDFSVPMLYVTHHAEEIMALVDRVLVLDRGEVTGSGTPGEIFRLRQVPEWVTSNQGA